jgi:hypothetical protein
MTIEGVPPVEDIKQSVIQRIDETRLQTLYRACKRVIEVVDPQFTTDKTPDRNWMLLTVSDCIQLITGIMNCTSAVEGVISSDQITVDSVMAFCDRLEQYLTKAELTNRVLSRCTQGSMYPGCRLENEYNQIIETLRSSRDIVIGLSILTR